MDIFRRTRALIALIVLLVACNITLAVVLLTQRQGGSATPTDPAVQKEQIERALVQEMGFDRAQIDTFVTLRRTHHARMRELNAEMRRLKEQLFDGVLDDDPNPALSDSLLTLTQTTQHAIEVQTFEHLLAIKALCTPEQRPRLASLVRELLRKKPGGETRGKRE